MKAQHNQNIIDLSLQAYGNTQSLMAMLLANDISLTDTLEAGQELITPASKLKDDSIVQYYQARRIKPATALTELDQNLTEDTSCNYCKFFE